MDELDLTEMLSANNVNITPGAWPSLWVNGKQLFKLAPLSLLCSWKTSHRKTTILKSESGGTMFSRTPPAPTQITFPGGAKHWYEYVRSVCHCLMRFTQ